MDGSTRFHHLDAVRAFALLLGVFFHAAESFGPKNGYWAIVDSSPTMVLEFIRFGCHSFRMELFFVVAGFFARLLLAKRGVRGFTTNRLARIGVPLVVGWAILYPILVTIWVWGHSVSGKLAQFGVPPEAHNVPPPLLALMFFVSGGFLQKFDLTHLWFLHQLLAIYGLVLLAVLIAGKFGSDRIMRHVDRVFSGYHKPFRLLLVTALLACPALWLMRGWGVDTPKQSLIPQLGPTLLYSLCFFLGWLWHRQPELLGRAAKAWAGYLIVGAVLWCFLAIALERVPFRSLTPEQVLWARMIHTVLYATMMWALALGFLGVFTRFSQNESLWTRYFADAAYWVYLVHLPVVVALQVLVGPVLLPWPIKYGFILVVTFAVTFTSYHYLVRGTFIGKQLNGHKYPLIWPWQNPRPNIRAEQVLLR